MAAGPWIAYPEGILRIATSEALFLTHTIRAALLANTYVPDLTNHLIFSNVSTHQIADAGYVQQTLGSKTITKVGGLIRFDAADIDFGNAVTLTARYGLIYDDTPATNKYLLWYCDLNLGGTQPISSVNSDFDFLLAANGLYQMTP